MKVGPSRNHPLGPTDLCALMERDSLGTAQTLLDVLPAPTPLAVIEHAIFRQQKPLELGVIEHEHFWDATPH